MSNKAIKRLAIAIIKQWVLDGKPKAQEPKEWLAVYKACK